MSKLHQLPIVDRRVRGRRDGADKTEPTLRVGDLARACGKTVRAIHHYENLGLLTPAGRSKGGYRLYDEDAVARVTWINKLHEVGLTLTQIQDVVERWSDAPTAPEAMAEVRAIYHAKLREVREQICRLKTLERELVASVDYLDTCDSCHPRELVAACSNCTVHEPSESEPGLVAGLYAGAP